MVASEMSDPEMCEYLLSKGADVKYSPKGKCSVLTWVLRQDNLPILKYFVDQRGCEIDDEILDAARYCSTNCLKYLITEKRMSANYVSPTKGFLLGAAAGEGRTDVCKFLIEECHADVNLRPNATDHWYGADTWHSALWIAEKEGKTETAAYLRSKGGKVSLWERLP